MIRWLIAILFTFVIYDPYGSISYGNIDVYHYGSSNCWEDCIHVTESEGSSDTTEDPPEPSGSVRFDEDPLMSFLFEDF